jgi:hypothetical protein
MVPLSQQVAAEAAGHLTQENEQLRMRATSIHVARSAMMRILNRPKRRRLCGPPFLCDPVIGFCRSERRDKRITGQEN